jgi:hypothetical protein
LNAVLDYAVDVVQVLMRVNIAIAVIGIGLDIGLCMTLVQLIYGIIIYIVQIYVLIKFVVCSLTSSYVDCNCVIVRNCFVAYTLALSAKLISDSTI